VFGRRAPAHLPRHLLFRILAYRLQADHFGDLDPENQRLLDRSESPEKAGQRAASQIRAPVGTVLAREWKGQMQRVTVIENGLPGKARSIKSVEGCLAITGTRWNGPISPACG
jgi:hypothetical protein